MSADNPLVNIITGEPLKSGQGGVIGVVAAVWVLAKIRKFISKRMPEALDLVLSSFIALTLTGLITLFFIYAGGLLLSYAAGFVLTYFFGVPKEAEQPAETLEELEMQ